MSDKSKDKVVSEKKPGAASLTSKSSSDSRWPKAGPILTDWAKRPRTSAHILPSSHGTKQANSVVGPEDPKKTSPKDGHSEDAMELERQTRVEDSGVSGSNSRSSYKSLGSDSRSDFSARRVDITRLQDSMVADAAGTGSSRTLMMNPGQGGTFGYGDRFKDEHGNFVTPEESEATGSKIRHLNRYDAKLIGTKDCVTCLGVYFEIEGNRVFCAHINAWHNEIDEPGDGLQEWTFEYADIRKHIWDALTAHSLEHGWTRDDAKKDTVVIVCPKPEETAFAVPDAVILDFLGFEEPQYPANAHGFLAIPGGRTKEGNPQVQLLKVEYRDGNRERESLYEDMPVELDEVRYVDANYSFVEQEWTYTVGFGFHSR